MRGKRGIAWRRLWRTFAQHMSEWEQLNEVLAQYPKWLVAIVLALSAVVAIWLLAKLLKWTIYAAAAVALVCVLAGIAVWWLG